MNQPSCQSTGYVRTIIVTSSVIIWANQKAQLMELKTADFPKDALKSGNSSFLVKTAAVKNSPKSHQIFKLLLYENISHELSKIAQSGHSGTKYSLNIRYFHSSMTNSEESIDGELGIQTQCSKWKAKTNRLGQPTK